MAPPGVEAKQPPDEGFLTVLQIYQNFLHHEKVKIKSCEWKQKGATLTTKATEHF